MRKKSALRREYFRFHIGEHVDFYTDESWFDGTVIETIKTIKQTCMITVDHKRLFSESSKDSFRVMVIIDGVRRFFTVEEAELLEMNFKNTWSYPEARPMRVEEPKP